MHHWLPVYGVHMKKVRLASALYSRTLPSGPPRTHNRGKNVVKELNTKMGSVLGWAICRHKGRVTMLTTLRMIIFPYLTHCQLRSLAHVPSGLTRPCTSRCTSWLPCKRDAIVAGLLVGPDRVPPSLLRHTYELARPSKQSEANDMKCQRS